MKKSNKRNLCFTLFMFVAFVVWTILISYVDLQAIGPRESVVGFATLNGWLHKLTGVHMLIYTITDWLGLVPLCIMLGFALLGLVQLIKRRSLFKVDWSIIVLGGFYILVLGGYLLFEYFVINYRPVLIEGILEASYPSSTTMLVMCVIPTAVMQLHGRIQNSKLMRVITILLLTFMAFMVIGRLVSGVHWFTDIIGGVLISAGLVMLYETVTSWNKDQERE